MPDPSTELRTGLPPEPRLFVAIEMPAAVRQALDRLEHDLQRRRLEGLRWVRPEGIHLTLKFLGETPRERLPEITQALAATTDGIPPHTLSLGRLGTFGGRNSPRVLWLELEGETEPLTRLQRQVDHALARLGFPKEARRFSPHVTLARVRPDSARAVAGPLGEAVQAVSPPRLEVAVRELSLMLSKLGPGGAVYTRLEAFPL